MCWIERTLNMRLFKLAAILALLLPPSVSLCQKQEPAQDEESSRQIVLDRFNKARPLSESVKAGIGSGSNSTAARAPIYRRTGATRLSGRRGTRLPATEEIGVTVWRLRPARSNDEGGRVLVLEGLK